MSTPKHNYPLDSSVVDRLDPQYVEIYRQHIQHLPQVHLQPVATSRASGKLNFGESTPSEVASIIDYSIPSSTTKGHEIKLRAYTPVGDIPDGGWPALLYFHG
jgi:acetyl esterase/lipase